MNSTRTDVTIEGKVRIGVTVTCADPDRRSPAVVLIMGTGKLDKDGNGTGFHSDLYKNMAAMFVEWGCVTVQYDKRGCHSTEGDFNTAGLSDLVDDAVSVIEYTKGLPCVDPDRVIVCGHSEGAIIATILSQREDVAGLILLGGAAMGMKEALYYQNRALAKEVDGMKGIKGAIMRRLSSEEKNIAKVDKIFDRCRSADKPVIRYSGVRMSTKWWKEHESYTSEDLAGLVRAFGKPVLAITGDKDVSSDYHCLDRIRGAPNVECYVSKNVNHILREIDDDNSMLKVKKQYARLASRPMDGGTVETIHAWMGQFLPEGQ
jgi:hypothetical protein